MIVDRPFRIAFLLSIGIHSILFSPLSSLVNKPFKTDHTDIEVTYVEITKKDFADTKPVEIKHDNLSLQENKDLPKENALSENRELQKKDSLKEEKKKPSKKEETFEPRLYKRTIDLNSVSFSSGTKESLNYFRAIRDTINTYIHKNYISAMGQGQALLHFVLNPDGSVQSVSIIKDDTRDNKRLKDLCMNSIYRSSPFNPFPKDLDLPHAAFNISISFKKR